MISASFTPGRAASSTATRGTWSLERLLLVVTGVLVLLYGAVLAYHALSTLAFPFDLDYGEGYVLNDAVRLAHGQPIYVDLQQFPMVRSPYPPLFPWLWSLAVPFTGPELWFGRALSIAGLAWLVALAWVNARKADAGSWASMVAPGILLASPLVYQWAAYARVDLLAVAAGATAVVLTQWSTSRRTTLVAGLLCCAAIATKQTAIAAPTAIGLALLVRDWRRAVLFGLVFSVPVLVGVVALNQATDGQFVRHVIQGNAQNPFNVPRMIVYTAVFAALHLPVIGGVLYWCLRGVRRNPSPITLYALLALAWTLTVGNEGSSVNYFMEAIAACSLVLPFAWQALEGRGRVVLPALAALQLVLFFHWPNGFGTDYLGVAPHGRTPTAEDLAVAREVDTAILASTGPVISEPAGFAVRERMPVYLQPIDLRAEQLHGRWDSTPLVEALSNGRFPMVVRSYRLFPSDMQGALDAHFDLVRSFQSDDGLTFDLYQYRS